MSNEVATRSTTELADIATELIEDFEIHYCERSNGERTNYCLKYHFNGRTPPLAQAEDVAILTDGLTEWEAKQVLALLRQNAKRRQ